MAELEYRKLSDDEIAEELRTVDRWSVEGSKLTKTLEFPEYLKGVDFAAKVGYAAEALNHHPDITIGWRKVKVSMNTHDVGGAISPYDFELARRIDAL
jgi:4a-hydroxytetrahydrobiopterin dehydratase